MTPNYGSGLFPAGLAFAGFGSVAVGDDYDPSLGAGNAQYLDPETGLFKTDEFAKPYLMTAAQEMVVLSFRTRQGSSIVQSIGQNFGSIKMITNNVEILIKNEVARCLDFAISNNFIELLEVNVKRIPNVPSRLSMEVIWRDIGSNTVETYLLET